MELQPKSGTDQCSSPGSRMLPSGVQLGLGLLSLGREWGHRDRRVPDPTEVNLLLSVALEEGIRFFDTAPSYGISERQLGVFLRSLDEAILSEILISTKFGECWDARHELAFTDHSYRSLCDSVDRSLHELGRVDILMLHKATPELLLDSDVQRAFQYALSRGVHHLGVSAADVHTADQAVRAENMSVIQVPYNLSDIRCEPILSQAHAWGKYVVVNRPFGMGHLLYDAAGNAVDRSQRALAFGHILRHPFDGVILTGTKSANHLRENVDVFRSVLVASQRDV